MPLLEYISDQNLYDEVEYLLKKAINKRNAAEKSFNSNVIDPFGALFEAPGFTSHQEWRNSEIARQRQKTIQNHVGTFHQKILGHVNGWKDLGRGKIVDLVNDEKKIIAEIKNKYSTVTGGDLSSKYEGLEKLIMPKHSLYKGYRAYFVNIIPKKPARSDVPFTPSNKDNGAPCASNPDLRIIDGASFYEIVTGRANALAELHGILPQVIEFVCRNRLNQPGYTIPDKKDFIEYFKLAYVK